MGTLAKRPRFGIYLPTGWRRDFASLPDPRRQWERIVGFAVEAERAGYDSVWAGDHLQTVPMAESAAVYEAWMTLAAVSQHTTRVRLGQIVTCAAFRPPALLAKMAAVLDIASGGRLEIGIGAGWVRDEFEAFGYEWVSARDRIARLDEVLSILISMWSDAPQTYHTGAHFNLQGARCDPKPLQRPHPPVLIGAAGERYSMRLVAQYGNKSNFTGTLANFVHKSRVLDRLCEEIGRDPAEITRTYAGELFVRETAAELSAAGSRSFRGAPFDEWREEAVVGTPDQVRDRLAALRDAGVEEFILSPADPPSSDTMRLFAELVMPSFAHLQTD